jgi:mRNA interferase MazF
VIGSEQGGLRPVLIIQNDIGNKYSPTVIAAAITSRLSKTRLPTHIDIYAEKVGLAKNSVILLEQIRTIDKKRLKEKMGHLDDDVMNEVNDAITISFGLGGATQKRDYFPAERAPTPAVFPTVNPPGTAASGQTRASEPYPPAVALHSQDADRAF